MRQVVSTCLLLLFLLFQGFLNFHQHDIASKIGGDKGSSLHHKCDVCDFVAKKQTSVVPIVSASLPQPILTLLRAGAIFDQTQTYTYSPNLRDNRGPPHIQI